MSDPTREEVERVLVRVLHWAESRCPCYNEQPNSCPLCGASVENLEACKSAENTLPRDILQDLRNVHRGRAVASKLRRGNTPPPGEGDGGDS